jgi:hypothetical protein
VHRESLYAQINELRRNYTHAIESNQDKMYKFNDEKFKQSRRIKHDDLKWEHLALWPKFDKLTKTYNLKPILLGFHYFWQNFYKMGGFNLK